MVVLQVACRARKLPKLLETLKCYLQEMGKGGGTEEHVEHLFREGHSHNQFLQVTSENDKQSLVLQTVDVLLSDCGSNGKPSTEVALVIAVV